MAKAKSKGRVTYTDSQKQSRIQKYQAFVGEGLSKIDAAKKVKVSYLTMKKWTEDFKSDASSTISKAISGGKDIMSNAESLVKNIRRQVIQDAIKALQSLQ